MKKSSYGWGFIASGLMAKMMADDLQLTEGSRIMGVTARTEASANNFANTYGVPNVYPSVEELVNDPEVDIVYISTPHNLHYENALTSLKAGKPVLLEKPFTVNAAQAFSLVEMAREKKLFLMRRCGYAISRLSTNLDRSLMMAWSGRSVCSKLPSTNFSILGPSIDCTIRHWRVDLCLI